MFYHLQYIHLFRPFLKYTPAASPLPAHVSPRRICTANAGAISKLMRLYKKLYDLRQICNIAVYMVHSACAIHMLNLPEKTAKRDVIHGVRHLEEIAEDWLCARRSLSILSVLARKWKIELPEEAALVLQRTDEKYGTVSTSDVPSPSRCVTQSPQSLPNSPPPNKQEQAGPPSQYDNPAASQMSLDLSTAPSMSSDMLSSMTVPVMARNLQNMQNQPGRQMTQPISAASMSMRDTMPNMSGWTMPAVTRTVSGYAPSFAPVHSAMAPATSSRPAARQISPTSLYGIDGQEWYLKDGVNWQQNFETWGLGAGPGQQPSNQGRGGGAGAGMGDASMFMFRGLRGNDMDTGFDSLGTMGLDHLPGLD